MTYANSRTEEKQGYAEGNESIYQGCNETKDGGEEERGVERCTATQKVRTCEYEFDGGAKGGGGDAQVPQPTAPSIMPANMEEDTLPI